MQCHIHHMMKHLGILVGHPQADRLSSPTLRKWLYLLQPGIMDAPWPGAW